MMEAVVLQFNKSRKMPNRDQQPQLYVVENDISQKKEDPDLIWVRKAKEGDNKAFDQLFSRNLSRVTGMCNRMLHHKGEVEDAVQQTFLKAWKSINRFEERSLFSTWLTRIAMYTCLNIRRRLKRLFITDAPLDYLCSTSELKVSQVSVVDQITDQEYLKACDQVLQKLSLKRRAVFVLSDLEDYRCSEIASILEIPASTARTRLFHARKDFAKIAKENAFLKSFLMKD